MFIPENCKGGPVALLKVKIGSFSEMKGPIKARSLLAVKYGFIFR
jgi:hypothetical protein